MKMIATKELSYSRVTYEPGDEFECSVQDANTLRVIGMAKSPDSDVSNDHEGVIKKTRAYKRRDITAEQSGNE